MRIIVGRCFARPGDQRIYQEMSVNSTEYGHHNQLPDDDEVEITDLNLSDNTDNDLFFLPVQRFLHWQHSLTRRSLRRFFTLGIVLLVFVAIWPSIQSGLAVLLLIRNNPFYLFDKQPSSVNLQQRSSGTIKPSMVFLPQTDGLACLADAAWSPNSRYIALLGYQDFCWGEGQSRGGGAGNKVSRLTNGPGLIVIHDALSGKRVGQIQIEPAIWRAFHARFPDKQETASTFYWPILWSHDGQQLVLLFSINFPPSSPTDANTVFNGVLLFNQQTGQARVLLQRGNISSHVEWDLQSGKALNKPPVPILTDYQWRTDGSLGPAIHYQHFRHVVGGPALSPVGDPVGSYLFSIWQPGVVVLNTQTSSDGKFINSPPVYTWHTNFVTWSPDGRYLYASLGLAAILNLTGEPAPPHEALAALHLEQMPSLRVRDIALYHLLKTLSDGSSNTNINTLAWRPNGQLLAAYDAGMLDLDIFDCGTGYEVASLQLPSSLNSPQAPGYSQILRWSPDGSHLLWFDQQVGKVALWNVGLL